ncbi:hypothetical protein SAMN04489713_1411, partial [Actinomadura madurae]
GDVGVQFGASLVLALGVGQFGVAAVCFGLDVRRRRWASGEPRPRTGDQ